ncbi:hypothetical protein IG631_12529 [Alternaria alternata]|nr:hypothetical protein IG631_12529 [Alternaria alternata]
MSPIENLDMSLLSQWSPALHLPFSGSASRQSILHSEQDLHIFALLGALEISCLDSAQQLPVVLSACIIVKGANHTQDRQRARSDTCKELPQA